jgi:transcriptional regulator with XRE-family HTH domain
VLVLAVLVLASSAQLLDDRDVDETVARFGENVREARQAHGWTQEELARRSGLASVQISRIERGKREVRLTTLVRLLDALSVSADDLLSR